MLPFILDKWEDNLNKEAKNNVVKIRAEDGEKMDRTLGYLREILSNYIEEHPKGRQLYRKLSAGNYSSEETFVRHLSISEMEFLNKILPKEIKYANEELDQKRAKQLNEVYELLL